MNQIKIYKITMTQNINDFTSHSYYSFKPWGNDTGNFKGFDDGGHNYNFPDGYYIKPKEFAKSFFELYNKNNKVCELCTNNDLPYIHDSEISECTSDDYFSFTVEKIED